MYIPVLCEFSDVMKTLNCVLAKSSFQNYPNRLKICILNIQL